VKILLVGPIFANAGHSAEEGVYDALRALEHEVDVWDHRAQSYQWSDGSKHKCQGMVPAGKPFDVVLCLGPGLPKSVLESILFKSLNGIKVLWNSEPIRLPAYREKLVSQKGVFKKFFSFDESELPIYRELGFDADWLPQGFFSQWYQPLDQKLTADICMIASFGGKWCNRLHLINRVRKAKFELNAYAGMFNAVEVNRLYNAHKVVLNLGLYHSDLGPPSNLKSYGLQQRIFEAVGAGRVCVTNSIPAGTNELFEDRKNILFYDSQNLEEVIQYGLDNWLELTDNVRAIRKDHTYEARMKQLLEQL
jgi:hypothetical protein